MLRSSFTRSQAIYTLFNHFVDEGGFTKIMNMLKEGKNIDTICFLAIGVALSSFMPPRMAVEGLYKDYLESLV